MRDDEVLDRWWLCAHEDPCVHPGEDLLWDHCTGCRAWAGEPCNCADGDRDISEAVATQRCLVHMEPDVTNCRGCAADRKAAS